MIRMTPRISPAYLILFCAATLISAPAQKRPVKNIVLVHGAWADGSGWKDVYDLLTNDSYRVSIVQEPQTSFKEDVAATKRVISLQDGPCILVAHSYGGAVITEAGTDPSVVGLVYIAAHMPDSGEKEFRRREALSERSLQIECHKENARRFHIYRPGAIS